MGFFDFLNDKKKQPVEEKRWKISISGVSKVTGFKENLQKEEYHNSEWEQYSDEEIETLKKYINSLVGKDYWEYNKTLWTKVPELKLDYIGHFVNHMSGTVTSKFDNNDIIHQIDIKWADGTTETITDKEELKRISKIRTDKTKTK